MHHHRTSPTGQPRVVPTHTDLDPFSFMVWFWRPRSPLWTWLAAAIAVLAVHVAVAGGVQFVSVIRVPEVATTVIFGSQTHLQVACDVQPHTFVQVAVAVLDGNGVPVTDQMVEPTTIEFQSNNTSETTLQSQNFTLYGEHQGRFYLTYTMASGDLALYRLGARSTVVVVTDEAQGWKGIWYELAFNGTVFLAGVLFFVWRRLHRVDLPIWQRHRAGLFERVNYDDVPPQTFEKRYREIRGDTLCERMRQYWAIPCDANYVCHTSGIPAALLLRFHIDAGHLCAILTVFSLGTLLPVNYVSGSSHSDGTGAKSFQQFTISNVPLYSDWFWVHVAFCYLVAFLILAFLIRQHTLLSTLRRRTKRIVGGRSILIHAGLPPSMTTKKLRALLSEYYDSDRIDDVTVVFDFHKLHHLLDRRQELAQELDRIRGLDAGYEHGMLSCSLLWCPGSVMIPSPAQVLWSYVTCRPCRYYWRHTDCRCCCWKRELSAEERLTYSKVSSEREIVDSKLAREFDALDEELDFFPEEAIDMYEQRQCIGAAFVVFDSAGTRDDFVRLVNEQSCWGRMTNAVHDRTYTLRYSKPRPPSPRKSSTGPREFGSTPTQRASSLTPYLANLVVTSAPEPDDVLWKNLRYEPLSIWKIGYFLARQATTILLLLLFSTPTAVLVYLKLDSSSNIYRQLYAQHWVLVSLVATYLPSLLLIAVNWGLLTFLFFMAMIEPSISDSRRTKSFLVNGFMYLTVSSVFLPSIGVTAAYLAFSEMGANHKNYVEAFLFKVSGTTFFISYICQRTFLGSLIELTRMGERLAYQPWVLARSVTIEERREARKPLPYYFGHDYAVLTSVLLVILLGAVITPVLTLFGALFFYVKFWVAKYNFLYVLQYTPGRGHIAQTAYSLVAACLVVFELVMAFVFLQIAGRRQFVAMIVLLTLTALVYFFYIADMSARVKHKLSDQRNASGPTGALLSPSGKIKSKVSKPRHSTYQSPKNAAPTHPRRTIFSPVPLTLEEDLGLLESYTDPYKVALSVFKLLGVHEKFHSMSSSKTQLKCAFHRLKRNARTRRPTVVAPVLATVDESDGLKSASTDVV